MLLSDNNIGTVDLLSLHDWSTAPLLVIPRTVDKGVKGSNPSLIE